MPRLGCPLRGGFLGPSLKQVALVVFILFFSFLVLVVILDDLASISINRPSVSCLDFRPLEAGTMSVLFSALLQVPRALLGSK